MKLAIIAAIGPNRVIGKKGKLPWHIPEDLRRFKQLTTGHTVLIGRRTFESIGKPLANRRNVVITSRSIAGVETFPSVDEALAALSSEPVVFVIGGARIYAETLSRANSLYLTLIREKVDGDTFFPPYEHLLEKEFTLVRQEELGTALFVEFVRAQETRS